MWHQGEVMYSYISGAVHPALLLLLILSVGDDITQVLVVQVPSDIQGEVCEHLVHLQARDSSVVMPGQKVLNVRLSACV